MHQGSPATRVMGRVTGGLKLKRCCCSFGHLCLLKYHGLLHASQTHCANATAGVVPPMTHTPFTSMHRQVNADYSYHQPASHWLISLPCQHLVCPLPTAVFISSAAAHTNTREKWSGPGCMDWAARPARACELHNRPQTLLSVFQDHSLLLQSGLGEQSTFPELTSSGGAAAEDEQGVNTQRPEAAKLAAAAPAVADGRSGQPAREAMRDKAPYFVDGTGTARQLSEVEELPACKELGSPSWGRGRSHGRIGHKRRHRSSSSPHSRSDSGSGRRRRHRGDSRPRGRSDSRGGHRHRHRGDSSPRGRSDSHSRHRHRYTGNSSPRSRGDSPRRLDHTSRHRDSSCRSKSPRNSADSQEQRRTRGSSVSPSREAAADAPMWVNGVLLDYR